MKIKFFKKRNNLRKKDFSFDLNFYWKLGVCGSLVIILFSFFFGYRLFVKINDEPALPVVGKTGQIPTVKQSRMEKVLNIFSERENKSSQIINSLSPVVDPSR